MSEIQPPEGLEASGRSLWDGVTGPYLLTPAELSILTQACFSVDELVRLEAAVRELPDFVVRGSTGQPKPHPLLSEVRAHRQLLQRLIEGLNLPDQDQQVGLRAGARRTAKAAQARWANHEKVS